MKYLQKLKQNIKKSQGFTLTELIVVLVILAIMAAILIPSLVGWMNKAKNQKDVVAMNTVVKACKSAYTEVYAEDPVGAENIALISIQTLQDSYLNILKNYLDGSVSIAWSTEQARTADYYLTVDRENQTWKIILFNYHTTNTTYYYESAKQNLITNDYDKFLELADS